MNQNEDSFSGRDNVVPTLDYAPPEPRRGVRRVVWDAYELTIDFLGGKGNALVIATVALIGFGVSIGGYVGTVMIVMGAGVVQASIRNWAESTRW